MIITDHIQERYIGGTVTYRLYEPVIPSPFYLIWLHGKGEIGPADGSMLYLVERHGFPKYSRTFEFPFNIVAPQMPTDSYSGFIKALAPWIKYRFNPLKCGVAGYSLGAMAAYSLLAWDEMNYLDFIVSLAGKGTISLIPSYRSIPGLVFHGDKDIVVSYSADKAFCEAYNTAKESALFTFVSLPGLDHGICDDVANVVAGKDWALQFCVSRFGAAQGSDPYIRGRSDMLEEVKSRISSIQP
jgi:pimeloyl-ACP methyl ester carboxylesterase